MSSPSPNDSITPNLDLNDPTTIILLTVISIYITVLVLFHILAILYSLKLFKKSRSIDQVLYTNTTNANQRPIQNENEFENDSINQNDGISDERLIITGNSSNNNFIESDENNSQDKPHIVILKPLKTYDRNLEYNIFSFLGQDYPNYSIVLSIGSYDDPAYPVARKIYDDFYFAKSQKQQHNNNNFSQQNLGRNSSIDNFDDTCSEHSCDDDHHPQNSNDFRFSRGSRVIPEIFYTSNCHKIVLQVDSLHVGTNPKINNLISSWRKYANSGDYKYIWIADANIFALPGTLTDMYERITSNSKIAVCHGMPYNRNQWYPDNLQFSDHQENQNITTSSTPATTSVTSGPKLKNGNFNQAKFGELVEKIYFGTQHGRQYLVWNLLGQPCLNGQSNLINLRFFKDAIGDLSDLSKYIAEDYYMGKLFFDKGYKLILSRYPILQNPYHDNNLENNSINAAAANNNSSTTNDTKKESTLKRYLNRMIRWTRLRITMIPLVSLAEPFTECLFSLIIITTLIFFLFKNTKLWFIYLIYAPSQLLIWLIFDMILQTSLDRKMWTSDNFFKIIAAWLTREFITVYIQIKAVMHYSDITWAGQQFNVRMTSGESNAIGQADDNQVVRRVSNGTNRKDS